MPTVGEHVLSEVRRVLDASPTPKLGVVVTGARDTHLGYYTRYHSPPVLSVLRPPDLAVKQRTTDAG